MRIDPIIQKKLKALLELTPTRRLRMVEIEALKKMVVLQIIKTEGLKKKADEFKKEAEELKKRDKDLKKKAKELKKMAEYLMIEAVQEMMEGKVYLGMAKFLEYSMREFVKPPQNNMSRYLERYKGTSKVFTTPTRNLEVFNKGTDNIFKTVMIIAKRASQIQVDRRDLIDEEHPKFTEFFETNVEDPSSEAELAYFEELDKMITKPTLIATQEYLDDRLHWKEPRIHIDVNF